MSALPEPAVRPKSSIGADCFDSVAPDPAPSGPVEPCTTQSSALPWAEELARSQAPAKHMPHATGVERSVTGAGFRDSCLLCRDAPQDPHLRAKCYGRHGLRGVCGLPACR